MTVLAFDASTKNLGFAFGGSESGIPRSGLYALPGADELVFDRTLAMASDSLAGLARMIGAKHIAIEAPLHVIDRFHSAAAASALIQMTGALRAASYKAGCKVSLISVAAARKHFIGTSQLQSAEAKAAVMARCRQLGWDHGGDDNRADAMAVWALAMARLYPKWAPQTTPLFASAEKARA